MRILIATDGSDPSAIGGELGRDLATLAGGEVRYVAVLPPMSDLLGGTWPPAGSIDPEFVRGAAGRVLEDRLGKEVASTPCDLRPSSVLLAGRPSEQVVAEATRWRADIIVVGSRGHGALSSILVGSVAEEVVDRSPVPVLVARRPRIRKLIVAHDGSPASWAAIEALTADETYVGLDAVVMDVCPTAYPWWLDTTLTAVDDDRVLQLSDESRRERQAQAESAAALLREAGLRANSCHRIGDAADQLVRAAAELDADTIVIGSRGRTGITRLVQGSVARHVIRHALASVLVIHPAPVAASPSATEAEAVPVGGPR